MVRFLTVTHCDLTESSPMMMQEDQRDTILYDSDDLGDLDEEGYHSQTERSDEDPKQPTNGSKKRRTDKAAGTNSIQCVAHHL